jgi:hypothetical protein
MATSTHGSERMIEIHQMKGRHYPLILCDACRERITDYHKAHVLIAPGRCRRGSPYLWVFPRGRSLRLEARARWPCPKRASRAMRSGNLRR